MEKEIDTRTKKQVRQPLARLERARMNTNAKEVTDSSEKAGSGWTRGWTLAGAAGWAAMAGLARLGVAKISVIELLFLLAPLVIVPLGMELGRLRHECAGAAAEVARTLQPVGALMAVWAMWMAPGRAAAIAATGWMVVCGMAAAGGVTGLARMCFGGGVRAITMEEIAANMAGIDLAVGGAWLVASRLGMRPMGIQEPIGLLTAVHFHFAGFATAAMASETLRRVGERQRRWLRWVVMAVVVLPFVVAAGFVASSMLKMAAGIAFSASVTGLAAGMMRVSVQDGVARVFLRAAAGVVFVSMALSAIYAVTDFMKSEALTIPRMATTHGVLNAAGFCLCGLLGYLIAEDTAERPEG